MKSVRRYQSQLLPRRSYKPARRARAVKFSFHPSPRLAVPLVLADAKRGVLVASAFSFNARWTLSSPA